MIRTILVLSVCGLVKSSGVHDGAFAQLAPVAVAGPEAPVINAPVVTAASSQYFQRTFNRLVVPPVVAPVAPPPLQPVFHVGPPPTVFVEPTRTVPVAVNPSPPTQPAPIQPNVAIAVATAHAAAPVATILLPPYPFGFPPNFGFIPSEQQPVNVPDENTKEPTTQSTTQTEGTTTSQEPEPTTPVPSGSDNNFVQAQPSNDNINFKQYGAPAPPNGPQFQPNQPRPQFQPNQRPQFQPQQPRPQIQPNQRPQFQPQQPRPQIQPLQPRPQFPLQQSANEFSSQAQPQYPPLQPHPQPQFPPQQPRPQYQPQATPQNQRPVYQAPQQPWPQQKPKPTKLKTSVEVVPVPLAYITPPPLHKTHAHPTHAHVKVVKHIYSFVPASHAKIIIRPVKIRPARLVKVKKIHPQNLRANARDIEVTTFSPFPRPNTKPPKV
ncbi:unnamed protein product [Chrysodeixis includens]|uniref:Uncharacterized protein n=1 Tax=Chrysodeixis includens TaxID=689277 RepID=A0A9P0BRY6_CHRIL|nr:unnamed protein product [Chrysodeixis includens]